MTGALALQRLVEAGAVATVIGEAVAPRDFCNALASFHAWSLSRALGAWLWPAEAVGSAAALDDSHAVAVRWEAAMELIQQALTDRVPSLAGVDGDATAGWLIVNHWGIVTAGALRAALLRMGHGVDMEMACRILPSLARRDSRLYDYLRT